jgi:hypothetical protein
VKLPGKLLGSSPALAVLATAALAPSPAGAASPVTAARGTTRTAIVRAFAAYDGNAAGVRAVYLARTDAHLAVVCEQTPDAGSVAFIFGESGHSWRYVTRGSGPPAPTHLERQLESACH